MHRGFLVGAVAALLLCSSVPANGEHTAYLLHMHNHPSFLPEPGTCYWISLKKHTHLSVTVLTVAGQFQNVLSTLFGGNPSPRKSSTSSP